MMPVDHQEVQEALFLSALKPLALVTQAVGIRKEWRHLVGFAGGVDRLSHGCGLWPNSSGIVGDSSLSIPCPGIPASRGLSQGGTAIAVAVLRTPAGLQSPKRGGCFSGNSSTRQASSARSEAVADQYAAALGPGVEAFRFLSAKWICAYSHFRPEPWQISRAWRLDLLLERLLDLQSFNS